MNKRKILISILIALSIMSFLAFIFLGILVNKHYLFSIDSQAISFVLSIRNEPLNWFVKIFTNFGSAIVIIVGAVVLVCFIRKWREMFFIGGTLGVGAVLSAVFKHTIARIRPVDIALITETGYSFPSGHTMLSLIFYGLLIYLMCKFMKNKPLKISLSILCGMVAVMVALTRVYLGVHFMTDIFGGWFLGGAVLVAGILVYEFMFRKKGQ